MVAGLKTFSAMDHYFVMDNHRKNFGFPSEFSKLTPSHQNAFCPSIVIFSINILVSTLNYTMYRYGIS